MGTRLALILAIVMGFISLIGVKSWLQQQEEVIVQEAAPVRILAAGKRIAENTTLKMDDLTAVEVPAKYVVTGMIPYSERALYYDRVSKQPLDKDKPIFDYMLDRSVRNATSRAVVDPNMRAVTIAVDQVKGVAGLIKPGDYVDVIGTFAVDNPAAKNSGAATPAPTGWTGANNAGRATKTILILQAARVISVDNRTNESDNADPNARNPNNANLYRCVTLQATLEDAVRLIDSADKGKLQLVLRNPTNTDKDENYSEKNSNKPTTSVDIINEIYKTTSKD